MVNPVPGHGVSTAYGARGPNWKACGFHTGADFAAPLGTPVVACISGTIRHRNYGSAFGPYQFAISPSAGQPWAEQEVFYAHVLERLPDGTEVQAGQTISRVGALGNATGPHLHLELHTRKSVWDCEAMANPQPVIDHQPGAPSGSAAADRWASGDVYLSKLVPGAQDSDSVRRLQRTLNEWSFVGGAELPITGNYGQRTQDEVAKFQQQICHDPGDGAIGPRQAARLFEKLGPWQMHD